MFKPKLSLQAFAAAIAQSVSKANEMLETDHKIAIQRFRNDQFGAIMPPPPPLMIQNVKVRFKGNVSKNDMDKGSGDLYIDLSRPDGNFNAEMEFLPFSDEMLKAAKHDGGKNIPFAAKPSAPAVLPPPSPAPEIPVQQSAPDQSGSGAMQQDDFQQPCSGNLQDHYDTSNTSRSYNLDI